jgi:hypothetical protein
MEYGSFGDIAFNSPGEGVSFVVDLDLTTVIDFVLFDSEELAGCM